MHCDAACDCLCRSRASETARCGMSVRKRGRGRAGGGYGIARTAAVDRAGTWAEIDDGGTVKIVTGVTEIGEGILTVLAQIAAEEIGEKPENDEISDNDNARTPVAA